MIDLSVNISGLRLANPVMPASGTFAEGLTEVMDVNRLGAFVTKTFTLHPRNGNPLPRVCELDSAMLNSIGIPGKGVDHFIQHVVPFWQRYQPPLIVSISANTADEFAALAERLNEVEGITAIEANISCPNIEADGKAFAIEAGSTARVIRALRNATRLPLWAKLTPNTSDIASVAQAVENEGGDAIVVGNTLLGMSIDIRSRRPTLGNIMGGLSGPAIKPIMLRMVYQCHRQVSIPIIGCGGISHAHDVIEYFYAGASAVQVGTATFIHPRAMITILDDLNEYCRQQGVSHIAQLTGAIVDDAVTPYSAIY
ncbi:MULTISPECIES: dihydroorotate dehydrogenase [unclassified Brenneria]|uniref:dihydroorotate dehydrogenase n=1 Tax=unclassified Brenneria TaxID=2634434 RepID=UPI0029C263FB|nr:MULTISPECIES: dihydroorotate dehydrogenase [unclassified Brenneria]MDX5630179.1 dihydroorotate dehydrogenase [Brenneria sp. L3-3Z]MDX5697324.1 dihydroorotate dehydrogenase [Brenneria sp. L4-2C]